MHKIGTVAELKRLIDKFPGAVYREAYRLVNILDTVYGPDRDIYSGDGGFVFIAESRGDLDYFSEHYTNPKDGNYEAVQTFQTEHGPYLNVFFLCNNEFGINLLMPLSLMPELTAKAEMR